MKTLTVRILLFSARVCFVSYFTRSFHVKLPVFSIVAFCWCK